RKILFRAPEYRKIATVQVTPAELAKWMEVPEADIKKAFDEHRSRYITPERRRVEQIVFPTMPEAETADARIKDGLSFTALAAERGLKQSDIDLGTVPKSEIIDPAVADAAFSLKDGEVSAPVKGRFGAVLVTVLKIEPEQQKSFADVTLQIRNDIATERAKTEVQSLHDKIEDERAGGSTLEQAAQKAKLPVVTYDLDRSGRNPAGEPQAASAPPPGSYSGLTHQSTALSFYVSADSTQMQDVSIPTVVIGCTPTNNFDDQLNVASIPIGADGSFTSTTMQSGVLSGAPATFTYTFTGHFHGTTSSGDEQVGGQLREDIVFNNGTSYSCTSDVQSWSVTRDTQGSQAASAPPPGSYSGLTHQSTALSFNVSADSTQLLSVSIPTVVIGCTPTNSFDDQLVISSIAIQSDGSFTGSASQSGTHNGSPAMFIYTFNGHFEGTSSSGAERVAGQLREDITFNNGTAFSCTSNDQSWSATH
ncbi:MAG: peptidyl-prolyl cis-trans isomerase, partial [Solirubrobacteraceae bacterium]